ncbi:MAG: MBL fold metallo-hydrolase [Deltaproteobacteria bacterium]|nr:MBL fold metallo-hydrolase [Deltaproteobacteria bacterium]
MKSRIDEIAPDLYRISIYFSGYDLQFNQFLVIDDEVLLYHTGMRKMFPLVREAVAKVVQPSRVRWIGFSHFEADECGSLNEWLSLAPQAEFISGTIAATVNLNDFAHRRGRVLTDKDILTTGRRRFRLLETPQVPHAWDSSLLLDETESVLFCSDLFLQNGDVAPLTEEDLVEPARQALLAYQAGPLRHPMLNTRLTQNTLLALAGLKPKLLAFMHGSSFSGNGERAILNLSQMYAATLGR